MTAFVMPTRILVYGFGPYRQFPDNVTEQVLRRLPARRWLKKVVFPVAFRRAQFIGAVRGFEPQVIVGLGQCSRGRRLRIETRATNRRRDSPGARPRPIAPASAANLFTTLRLQLNGRSRRSTDAGDYVCNYSMYVLLDFLNRRRLSVPLGFVHIPRRYDAEKAARILADALMRLARTEAGGARRRSGSNRRRARFPLENQRKKYRG